MRWYRGFNSSRYFRFRNCADYRSFSSSFLFCTFNNGCFYKFSGRAFLHNRLIFRLRRRVCQTDNPKQDERYCRAQLHAGRFISSLQARKHRTIRRLCLWASFCLRPQIFQPRFYLILATCFVHWHYGLGDKTALFNISPLKVLL